MKKRLLLVVLGLLTALGSWLWFRQQPAQQINRTVDQLFDSVAHQKISVRKPSEVREALLDVLAEEVTLTGLPFLPDQSFSRDKLLEDVETFQQLTTSCKFVETTRTLQIEDGRAQAYRAITVTFAYGPDTRTQQSWDLTLTLEKQDHWRITAIRAAILSRK